MVIDIVGAKTGGLAIHLSRNEEMKHFKEGDEEGLAMLFQDYVGKELEGGKVLEEWLKGVARSSTSVHGQVMNHNESIRYLKTLESLGRHFRHSPVYSTAWIKDKLHRVSGGVSEISELKLCGIDDSVDRYL